MTEKYVVLGIMFPFVSDLLSLILLRMIIYSILVGNVHSKKATYNKAQKIACKYKLTERIKQTYIINHIAKYIEEYQRYMFFKRIHIVWTIISLVVMFFLPKFLQNQQLFTVVGIRGTIAFVSYIALGLNFNYKHKTRFEK